MVERVQETTEKEISVEKFTYWGAKWTKGIHVPTHLMREFSLSLYDNGGTFGGWSIKGEAVVTLDERGERRGKVISVTDTGDIWIVTSPDSQDEKQAVSFDDLSRWNCGLKIPSSITRRALIIRTCSAGAVGTALGTVAGAAAGIVRMDKEISALPSAGEQAQQYERVSNPWGVFRAVSPEMVRGAIAGAVGAPALMESMRYTRRRLFRRWLIQGSRS